MIGGVIIFLQVERLINIMTNIFKLSKSIIILLWNPKLLPTAIKANYKAWISKEYSKHTEEKTKYDFIKSTATILSKCPNNCDYTLECCGCSIYAAVEENKQCTQKT